MKLYKLNKGVAEYYRKNTRDNEKAPNSIIQAKLSRNIAVCHYPPKQLNDILIYEYGNLSIYTRNGYILKLKNVKGGIRKTCIDHELYKHLNNVMGITEYENIGKVGLKTTLFKIKNYFGKAV